MSERASYRVLVVHNEPAIRQALASVLGNFCRLSLVSTRDEALASLARKRIDLVFLSDSLNKPDLLEEIDRFEVDLPVFVLSRSSEISAEDEVRCLPMRMLGNEPGRLALMLAVERAVVESAQRRAAVFRQRREQRVASDGTLLVGVSPAIESIRQGIAHAANSNLNVLLSGETGVGKTLTAECIHRAASSNAYRPFVVVEPAAVPASLFESEFFGHTRGSFTGASSTQIGAFEAANNGTLFLDEIGELPVPQQVKLLRTVESKVIRRVGDTREIRLELRVITATNRHLEDDLAAGKFRSDLYHRLNEISLQLPPLRERPEDVLPLLRHFVGMYGTDDASEIGVSPDATATLTEYRWPGNAREVRTLARRLVERGLPETITAESLAGLFPARATDRDPGQELPAEDRVREFRRRVYLEEMGKHDFNIRDAARAMEIPYATLHSRLKTLGILQAVKKKKREST